MIIHGTRTVATIGPRKHITITYPTPQETLLGAPVALPTSEPGSPQISFTIDASDMPLLSGLLLSAVRLSPMLFVAGHNPTGVDHEIFFRVDLNGSPLNTFSSTLPDPALQRWMATIAPISSEGSPIAQGDTLAIAAWSDDAALDYDYSALALFVANPRAEPIGSVLLSAAFRTIVQFPQLVTADILSSGGPNASITTAEFGAGDAGSTKPALVVRADRPFYQATLGDEDTGMRMETQSDTVAFYIANFLPTDISYYPTSLRILP